MKTHPLCLSGKLPLYSVVSLFLVLNFSCVNDIADDIVESGAIPVTIATRLQSNETRVTDAAFEVNDAIGLFITMQPAKVNQSRYADNVKFTCSSSDNFTPEATVYYPEGNSLCDFLSYFPYTEAGLEKKSAAMEVKVETDQSTWNSYSQSHFMVAETTGITPGEEPVELAFENKFSRINIQLNPQGGYTTDMLLDANPVVKIKNTHTKAIYNFLDGTVSGLNSVNDVVPYGDWEVVDEALAGKSVILVPQTLTASTKILELVIDGRVFECVPSSDLVLGGGDSTDITFSIVPSADGVKGSVSVSLKGWDILPAKELDVTETPSYIYIPDVNFNATGVYKVMNNGVQVAEICREYLLSDNVNARAVVAYPVVDGKSNLSEGLVCAVLGGDGEPVENEEHGGKVSWNAATGKLTYLPGSSAAVNYIYVSEAGEINVSRTENTLQLQLEADYLTDVRAGESVVYPVIKIATRYWISRNMKATRYTDGAAIAPKTDFSDVSAGLVNISDAYYFYNPAAIATGLLAPEGWRISNTLDWGSLKEYLNGSAGELRSGAAWGTSVAITNLSGFNASAVGVCLPNYQQTPVCVYYWSAKNAAPDSADKAFKISASGDDIEEVTTTDAMGLSIRCVRK